MTRNRFSHRPYLDLPVEPFANSADAWFWSVQCLMARRDGARSVAGMGAEARPCDPEDVVKSVERLYRVGRLTPHHLRVLVDYGARLTEPNRDDRSESRAARLWDEALDLLTTPFRAKGIVAS